ncbi:sigma-70 family RNA polymerase sigma factor [Myxococcaceae bacterium GXIMD 01537]
MSSGGVLDMGREGPADGASPEARARDERALVLRLRRGDPDAFEQLVRAHQDRVYDFCVRMLGDREEASDLVQEIFFSVHQNLRRFREDAKLSTWLFRISKNHCLNRLKFLKRRGRGRSEEYGEVSEGALAEALGPTPGPDAALEAARERTRVQWAIARLDPDARMLVALRDIEGLSYDEIVAITELPEGTVKSRLHRAREKLAALLGRLEE